MISFDLLPSSLADCLLASHTSPFSMNLFYVVFLLQLIYNDGLNEPPMIRAERQTNDRFGARVVDSPTGEANFYITVPVEGKNSIHFKEVSASLWFQGTWSPTESLITSILFDEFCSRGDNNRKNTVLDAGAHVGYYSLLALAHGCENVVAVEVNSYFVDLLKLSFDLNHFSAEGKHLTVHEMLIGNDELCHFNGQSNRKGWGFEGDKSNEDDTTVIYPTMSLDDIAPKEDDILYMKLDVEGTELVALNEGRDILERTKFLMVEVTIFARQQEVNDRRQQEADAAKTLTKLREHNYHLFRSDNDDVHLLRPIVDISNGYELTSIDDFTRYVEIQRIHCEELEDFHCQVDVFGFKEGEKWPNRITDYRHQTDDVDRSGKLDKRFGIYKQIEEKEEYIWPPKYNPEDLTYEFDVGVDDKIFAILMRASDEGLKNFPEICREISLGYVNCGIIITELEKMMISAT